MALVGSWDLSSLRLSRSPRAQPKVWAEQHRERWPSRVMGAGRPSVWVGPAAGPAPHALTVLRSCSLRAAVAVPPGTGDVLYGQLSAAHEGMMFSGHWRGDRWDLEVVCMRGRLSSREASETLGINVL